MGSEDSCVYLKYWPATWGYHGGSPAEVECRHPDGSGYCTEEDCPFLRRGRTPMTHADARAVRDDAKLADRREQ